MGVVDNILGASLGTGVKPGAGGGMRSAGSLRDVVVGRRSVGDDGRVPTRVETEEVEYTPLASGNILDDDHPGASDRVTVVKPPVTPDYTGVKSTGFSGTAVSHPSEGGAGASASRSRAHTGSSGVGSGSDSSGVGVGSGSSGVGEPGADAGRVLSYEEMFRLLNPEESPEEKKKRERREKREKAFSTIGDAITAFTSLYFATKGGVPTFSPENGMSAKAKERWERINAERKGNEERWRDGLLRAMQMDRAQADSDRKFEYQKERDAKTDEINERNQKRMDARELRAELKAEKESKLYDLKIELATGRITEQEYKNRVAEVKAEHADEEARLGLSMKQAQINKANRSGSGGSGRSGAVPKYAIYGEDGKPITDSNGNVVRVYTRDEAIARSYPGMYPTTTSVTVEVQNEGKPYETRTKKTNTKTHEMPSGSSGSSGSAGGTGGGASQSGGKTQNSGKVSQSGGSKPNEKWSNASTIKW